MSVIEDAEKLERLFPQVMTALFRSNEEDPLRHHSLGQIKLMRCLLGGSRTAGEVGHMLNLSPSSLTQMASRLVSAGLIEKDPGDHDKRIRKLSLTVAGLEMMSRRQATRMRAAAERLNEMPGEHREQLVQILTEIVKQSQVSGAELVEATV
jgi:DNA-binding MarR family transcriptional regulator